MKKTYSTKDELNSDDPIEEGISSFEAGKNKYKLDNVKKQQVQQPKSISREESEAKRLYSVLEALRDRAKSIESINELRKEILDEEKHIKELKGNSLINWFSGWRKY